VLSGFSDVVNQRWEELDFFLRMFGTARFQENGWQEPCESRDSRTDLWERGGEIPLRHPTHNQLNGFYISRDIAEIYMQSPKNRARIDPVSSLRSATHFFEGGPISTIN
jgi:hypothetical protein